MPNYDFNGETVRILVDKLPPHVFDYLIEEVPWLFANTPDKTEYIYWEPYSEENTFEVICDNYGFSEEDIYGSSFIIEAFDEGLLIIE